MSESTTSTERSPLPEVSKKAPELSPLPLKAVESTDTSQLPEQNNKPWWQLSATSPQRATALQAMAMREHGASYREIGEKLRISEQAVKNLLYKATRNGWLDPEAFADSKDRLDHVLVPKALDSLSELLNHKDPEIRTKATMGALKGTIFKSYDQQLGNQPQLQQIVAIKIEMPEGVNQLPQVREGTVAGEAAYEVEA